MKEFRYCAAVAFGAGALAACFCIGIGFALVLSKNQSHTYNAESAYKGTCGVMFLGGYFVAFGATVLGCEYGRKGVAGAMLGAAAGFAAVAVPFVCFYPF